MIGLISFFVERKKLNFFYKNEKESLKSKSPPGVFFDNLEIIEEQNEPN